MPEIKFTETIIIDNPATQCLTLPKATAIVLKRTLFKKRAKLIEGATTAAKGVKAYCITKNRIGVLTEYVTYNTPKATAIKMTKRPYMC